MLVVGILLGWVVHRAHVQRDALAAIRKAGGSVQYDWQYKDGGRIADGKPRGPKWLADRLGPDYFDTITTVSSGPATSDAELAHIGQLTQLEQLNLRESAAVTDAGLAHVKGLTRLRILYLRGTQVTDAGLAHIEGPW